MEYRVGLTERAQRDLEYIYFDINASSSLAANRWYLRLKTSILSLKIFPNRCPNALEQAGLRHLLFGKRPHVYRVIYRVQESPAVVTVLHIRHGKRDKAEASELLP